MKKLFYLIILFKCMLLISMSPAVAQSTDELKPLVLSDAVLPSVSKDPLLDPRIFNPEFYRKFNPDLGLTTDQEAIKQWASTGANHCLRGSFYFYATDYLKRYPDL